MKNIQKKLLFIAIITLIGFSITVCDNNTMPSAGTTYTVSYNGNGNTSGSAPVDSNSPYSSGTSVTVLSPGSLSRTGHTFAGWNTASSGSGTSRAAGTSFTITANTTLYAQWTPTVTSYTVTYNGNGNTSGSTPIDSNSPYSSGASVTVLSPGSLSRTGHTFAGWNTASSGSGTSRAAGSSFTITANTTLYAQWTPTGTTYTVSYNGNGNTSGSAPVDSNSPYSSGASVTVLSPGSLSRTGHTFAGWNTAANGSGTSRAAGTSFTITANTTLYAQWTPTESPGTTGLTYTLVSGTYTVSRGTATAANIVIPSTYNGLPVAAIAALGFFQYTNMTSITIPDNVKTIGSHAFRECTSLQSVSSQAIQSIGDSAFSYCTALRNANFPAVQTIGSSAFSNTAIQSANFPLVQTISYSAFSGCTSLQSVNFPAARTIGNDAFMGCTALQSIYFSAAQTIGNNSFYGCTSLQSANLPTVYSIGSSAFDYCTALQSLSIPAVHTIGVSFRDCTALRSVTLGTLDAILVSNFPGNLRTVYSASGGGAGTYVRTPPSTTWTKQ